jgi:hypothetical protein
MAVIVTSHHLTMAALAFAHKPAVGTATVRWIGWPAVGSRGTGWTVSAVVHLAAIGIAALMGTSLPSDDDRPQLESVWSPDVLPIDMRIDPMIRDGELSVEPGGREIDGDAMAADSGPVMAPNLFRLETPAVSPLEFASSWSKRDLLSPAGEVRTSHGRGEGEGDGVGGGSGFFGIPLDLGQRIVYVVDNSLSMNHKHDSPAKTRFKRVQVELINSIWHMQPQQQFFVIFFNRETAPMPARSLQPATPWAKEHFLTWVAEMKTAGAPTDPRQAMELALRLEPDIIYFLTDGEFDRGVNRQLLQIRQVRTTIHTFAFGDARSAAVLTDIAKNNQGKYTYIP